MTNDIFILNSLVNQNKLIKAGFVMDGDLKKLDSVERAKIPLVYFQKYEDGISDVFYLFRYKTDIFDHGDKIVDVDEFCARLCKKCWNEKHGSNDMIYDTNNKLTYKKVEGEWVLARDLKIGEGVSLSSEDWALLIETGR